MKNYWLDKKKEQLKDCGCSSKRDLLDTINISRKNILTRYGKKLLKIK